MKNKNLNHPFVTWAACLLWLISMFALTWSLLIFFYRSVDANVVPTLAAWCQGIGDMLLLTGTDLVHAFTLLSGLLMFPTNVFILYSIASGKTIDHRTKVVCCPLWLSISCIITINIIGVILCIRSMNSCHEIIMKNISNSLEFYRTIPKCKRFVDNLQWTLKCCGLKSYKDWFTLEWHDKIRDYEWDFVKRRGIHDVKGSSTRETDSVPFSCCKSGSCISNYLKELGTNSINTDGCGNFMYRIVMISINAHLVLFISIIIIETLLLKFICKKRTMRNDNDDQYENKKNSVRNLMPVNDDFKASSGSFDQEYGDHIEKPALFEQGNCECVD